MVVALARKRPVQAPPAPPEPTAPVGLPELPKRSRDTERRQQRFNDKWAAEYINGPSARPTYVYVLYDVSTGQVGYVGKTIDPTVRLYQHRLDYRQGGRHANGAGRESDPESNRMLWMAAVEARGGAWDMKVLGAFPTDDIATVVEFALINRYELHNTVHRWKGKEVHQTRQLVFLPEDTIPF